MIFVLVHGINDTSAKFKSLCLALEQQGHRCIAPSLTPNNEGAGLEVLAGKLQAFIHAELDNGDTPFVLVGFSMGGLIARYYLQVLGGYRRVSHFFSIAAPHRGTVMAYLSARAGAVQMRPNSVFLQNLQQHDACLQALPCYSYWTPFDLMILPASSSVWQLAENIKINSLCHPLLVRNRQLAGDMLAKVV
ncbi:alpha/beta fold hydrolase [Methylosoma difficile]